MKLTVFSVLLAASSAVASPTLAAREGSLTLTDFTARASSQSRTSTISFTLEDAVNYPDDTPTNCQLIWGPNGGLPREDACDNGQYLVRFANGQPGISDFTLEFERVSGSVPQQGTVTVTEDDEYTCAYSQGVETCTNSAPIVVSV
ncbi:hypothetical protein BJY01DRAFT_252605 [Aspergillus pseudoustus]|uniref:AA1-like domain-containing protein n=1 Tax=Aspergillus pseudoustus TaxID=1810923 RepID=A0ABR4J608_9EURO